MSGVDELSWGDEAAWIWGLVVLALLFGFIWLAQWRQGRIEALAKVGPLPEQLERDDSWRFIQRAALVLLGAALCVVALARPQWGTNETKVKNLGIDLVIALDASKSMRVSDIVPDRLTGSRLEITKLLDKLAGGRVALVPFAGLAFTQTPLTSDTAVVKGYLEDLRVEDMPRGGTALGRAITESLRALLPEAYAESGTSVEAETELAEFEGSKNKAIVIFTDGEDHEGDPIEAAEEAARRGVKIFTVGVGTTQGRPVLDVNEEGRVTGTVKGPDGKTPRFSALNVALLRQIAQTTGGDYFHLGASGLGTGLSAKLDALEKKEYDASFQNLGANQYQWAVLPAILLLFLEAWLGVRRRKRGSR